MYIFQERETVKAMMNHPSLASPMSIIVITLHFLFGMPESSLRVYRADDSGPLAKPYTASKVPPEARIDHLLHRHFNAAFTGPGLAPATRRFRDALKSNINKLEVKNHWAPMDDFFRVFGKIAVASLTHSLYGPLLLRLHPDIIDDLWVYDAKLPWLARGIPRFLVCQPYRVRDSIRRKLKDWYIHARSQSCNDTVVTSGHDDPVWGSGLVRDLQHVMHVERGTHDDDAMASHDLALLWA